MPRNLDLTALRSFVVVAETGGVTRASQQLNLTQSAVSMQLKRLEESLDQPLLVRSGRGVALTPQGDQVLSRAKRMLALNDEILARMTGPGYEGTITFGAPSDIIYPHIPHILQRFDRDYPRVKVDLISSYTRRLKPMLESGKLDVILTTEDVIERGAETLVESPLVWVGAPGGVAWRSRPLRLAFEYTCIFRGPVQTALDGAGIPWEMAVESDSTRTIEATVAADLAVHAMIESAVTPRVPPIPHGGELPALPKMRINLYVRAGASLLVESFAAMVREAYLGRAQGVSAVA